jgi:trimethylguanosine synthase
MTDDSWFGVTPEPVAKYIPNPIHDPELIRPSKIAQHLGTGTPSEKAILIDAFAGAGGNTIAFALSGRWKRVYAIEKDPQVLACAKHNAKVYGVEDLISFYEGDCFEIIRNELKEMAEYSVIFASPPWGG